MHPDLMREIMKQRASDRQEDARKISLARAQRKTKRQRDRTEVPDTLAPPIPDYVDGTFHRPESELPADRVGTAR
jgi:hypothetical protein